MPSFNDIHRYQLTAAEWSLERPGSALWMDMGLGKTVAALTTTNQTLRGLECRKCLVVAPKRPAMRVWPKELDGRWPHLAELTHSRLTGKAPARRKELLRHPEDIHVINYELLPWLVKQYGPRNWPYDLVVLDESTKVKNKGTQAWRALNSVRGRVRKLIELTGTPSPNGIHDLWGQIALLDGGRRLGATLSAFRSRWFRPVPVEERIKWEPMDHAQGEIQQRCSDICLSMSARDYLELPDLIPNTLEVELPPAVRKQYEAMEQDSFLEIEEGVEVEAMNAAATANKCLQVCNGAVYTDLEGSWQELHTAKLDALAEIAEGSGSPLLVVYQFKPDLWRLQQRFPEGRVLDESQETEDLWNAGRIPFLWIHPDSAGHGLNLQWGGNRIVFFGLTWNLESYQQVIERIGPTRQAQAGLHRPVHVNHIVVPSTWDEAVLDRLRNKRETQDVVMAYMSAKRRGIQ